VFWFVVVSLVYSFCKFGGSSRRVMPTCVRLFRFVVWVVTCVCIFGLCILMLVEDRSELGTSLARGLYGGCLSGVWCNLC
jgi:hypothetical protein